MGKVRRRTRVRSTTDSIRKPVRAGASSKLLRRFTRLTNGFSNKVENHVHAVALFTTYYDFVGVYKTLRVTPAMAAGVSDRLWEVADIVALVGSAKAPARKRGPDKNREHKSALL